MLPSIQEENENDKTSLQSGRKEEDSLSQKINSASKELPVHPSLDTDNNVGTPDTIDIIEEYPTGPVIIEESKSNQLDLTVEPPTPYKPTSHDLPLKVVQKEPRPEVNHKPQPTQPIQESVPKYTPSIEAVSRYGSTPHKEIKINEMLAQRAKGSQDVGKQYYQQPQPQQQLRQGGHERVKTQPLEVVTEPDYLRTESDIPERDGRKTAQTTTNKSSNSFVTNYNFTPTNNRGNERQFDLAIDASKANGLRNKSSERNSNVRNLNSSSSEPAKSPKSDKIRDMRGNSPTNTSMSRTSVFSNNNVDPSVLDVSWINSSYKVERIFIRQGPVILKVQEKDTRRSY